MNNINQKEIFAKRYKYLYNIYLSIVSSPYYLFTKKPKILSFEKTINEIVENKKSFSRYGDGEFRLMLDEGEIGFQKKDPLLSIRLNEVIISSLPNLLLGIPHTFRINNQLRIESRNMWMSFMKSLGGEIISRLDLNKFYGDSLITRFYMDYKVKNYKVVSRRINYLKKIWENQDLLIIEGANSKLGYNNDLFKNSKSIERIICPNIGAFSLYDKIYDKSKELGKNKLILIALGPTATILAHDLAQVGYWAIDIGHIDIEYSWFLRKAKNKISIEGKYVNEADIPFANDTFGIDKNYENSIRYRVI
jgi:glycosyltransferase family protein